MEFLTTLRRVPAIAPVAIPQCRLTRCTCVTQQHTSRTPRSHGHIAAQAVRPRGTIGTHAAEAGAEAGTDAATARQEENRSGRQLVVAIDYSDESERALRWTIDNFYKSGDVVHILHVVPFLPGHAVAGAVYYSPPPSEEAQERLLDDAEQIIDNRFRPLLEKFGVTYKVDLIKEDSSETIGEAVCHSAVKLDATAIVVAQHKKSTLAKFILGSSSREVAGKSDLPVLVFHG